MPPTGSRVALPCTKTWDKVNSVTTSALTVAELVKRPHTNILIMYTEDNLCVTESKNTEDVTD